MIRDCGTQVAAVAANQLICRLEAKYDLLKYEVDGWCAWPLLRYQVARTLANISMAERSRQRLSLLMVKALQDVIALAALSEARYLVKTYSSARAEERAGLYRDIYFDDLLLDIGDHAKYIKIEGINNPAFLWRSKRALIKSDLTSTVFEVLPSLLARIKGPSYVHDIAESLGSDIQGGLGLEAFKPHRVLIWLLHFYWAKKLYGQLLSCVHPQYVLVADGGEYAIVAAAKEQGIKTVELQHGFIDRNTNWTYSWSSYASQYKTRMPIPEHLFLYGDHWKQELNTNGFWGQSLHVVGSVRLDQYRQRKWETDKGDVCTLILTTQGVDQESIVTFIRDFLEVATAKMELRLFVKLHPVYEVSKEPYSNALRAYENVRVLLGNELPSTFELLSRSHFHLSVSSTCHYESLGFGVPTVILPFATHEKVLDLYKEGHAFLVHTPQDLFDIVSDWQHSKVPLDISEWYFKSGALENIKRELASLTVAK